MKYVKTACCVSVSMRWLCRLNSRTLQFKEKAFNTETTRKKGKCLLHLVDIEALYGIFAYTVWNGWQLKFLVARQSRKLGDEEAKNRPIFAWNQLLTKESFCSCSWLKLAILTSPRASRASDTLGLLMSRA